MTNIEWGNEPPPRQERKNDIDWPAVFAEGRMNPDVWGLVTTELQGGHSTASNIKQGRYGGLAKGEFDAMQRKNKDGTYNLWIKYLGGTTP